MPPRPEVTPQIAKARERVRTVAAARVSVLSDLAKVRADFEDAIAGMREAGASMSMCAEAGGVAVNTIQNIMEGRNGHR